MARAIKSKVGKRPVARARICVAEPAQLCGVQKTTRELCRSAGFSEGAVFQAVIAVTELAYRLHLESARRVELRLSALRRKNAGLGRRIGGRAPRSVSPMNKARATAWPSKAQHSLVDEIVRLHRCGASGSAPAVRRPYRGRIVQPAASRTLFLAPGSAAASQRALDALAKIVGGTATGNRPRRAYYRMRCQAARPLMRMTGTLLSPQPLQELKPLMPGITTSSRIVGMPAPERLGPRRPSARRTRHHRAIGRARKRQARSSSSSTSRIRLEAII